MRQLIFDFDEDQRASLDRFYVSRANATTVAQLRAWLDGDDAMPFYLWGDAGSGKSTLLAAASAHWAARGLRVGSMDAASLAQDFDPRCSAIVMDDVGRYSGEQQARAFNWFINAMYPPLGGAPCRILCAGDAPPVHMPLRDDLRSRLGWGHVAQLHPLDEADIRAALRAQARLRSLHLGEEVIDYMLTHFSRDMASLMPMLDMLSDFSLRQQRPITVPLLKAMMKMQEGDL